MPSEPISDEDAIYIYNCGYCAGHHGTVEGHYLHLVPEDMETYHAEVVEELLADMRKLARAVSDA